MRIFGATSLYYPLYCQNPAAARRRVWETYLAKGRSIRGTAQELGCSRNTVRDVVRRAESGRPKWDNKPARPGLGRVERSAFFAVQKTY